MRLFFCGGGDWFSWPRKPEIPGNPEIPETPDFVQGLGKLCPYGAGGVYFPPGTLPGILPGTKKTTSSIHF